jgi:DNA-binding transcriptional regulator YiaG
MELIDIRKITGLNRSKFAEHYGIPYRTLQDWELGKNKVPEYIKNLLERVVRYEFEEKD